MSKHTPGPWKFGVRSFDNDYKVAEKPFDYTGPGHYENPSIFGPDGREIVGCDEYMVFHNPADIRLMVAAPDLLEALKAMLEYYGSHTACVECQDMARAAIAKAEGKA